MTTQRTKAATASALAIVTLAFFVGGCDETNKAACERVIEHSIACSAPSGVDLPPEFDLYVSLLCATVPETSECDGWSAFADCITSISCTQSMPDLQMIEACADISTGLVDNDCFSTGFGF